MNTASPYRQADGVAIRPERFGALIYRHDNRRLYFIHSHLVADFILCLDGARPLGEAVEDFLSRRALPESAGGTLFSALEQLERIGVVRPVAVA